MAILWLQKYCRWWEVQKIPKESQWAYKTTLFHSTQSLAKDFCSICIHANQKTNEVDVNENCIHFKTVGFGDTDENEKSSPKVAISGYKVCSTAEFWNPAVHMQIQIYSTTHLP